nr:MAG TPA: hypothetical protein [Bacteriophage sp.]
MRIHSNSIVIFNIFFNRRIKRFPFFIIICYILYRLVNSIVILFTYFIQLFKRYWYVLTYVLTFYRFIKSIYCHII